MGATPAVTHGPNVEAGGDVDRVHGSEYRTSTNATVTATTNGRGSRKTLDGFGRTIKAETGYGTTTLSQVDTVYDSCGCTPMGKTKQVSMPHAPNATVNWTVYK